MFRKLDKNLKKVIIQNDYHANVDCLIFGNDLHELKKILHRKNFYIKNEFQFINAVEVSTKLLDISELLNSNAVSYISSQPKVTTLVNIARKIILGSNCSFSGRDIGVCFIDTGLSSHLDFVLGKKRIVKFIDFCNGYTKNYDDNGHGTFVTGVACGNGLVSNRKFRGFAHNANILSIKALDNNGEATASRILQAMQWVYDHCKDYNIKVVCMSFGSESLGINDPIMRGAEALWNKGITVVAAAGNSGPKKESIKSPGTSKKIITVGGFNDKRKDGVVDEKLFEIADFSSRGPVRYYTKPDLIAPAVDIVSCNSRGGYTTLSGTSVATPMIAGVVAQMLEVNPRLKPDVIKKLLISHCKFITFDKNIEGNGYPVLEKLFNL